MMVMVMNGFVVCGREPLTSFGAVARFILAMRIPLVDQPGAMCQRPDHEQHAFLEGAEAPVAEFPGKPH